METKNVARIDKPIWKSGPLLRGRFQSQKALSKLCFDDEAFCNQQSIL